MSQDNTNKSKRKNKSAKGKKEEKSYSGLDQFLNPQGGPKEGQSGGKNPTDSGE